ncbi:PQQ-binding-like beta-propeller repeat protein [Fimbriiglobus ruber]|uniref:Putative polyvinylalcohol dehydrogenase n=1 Tax=Fimbriiglobus ruber TaxID=1908690 RepID=A0A225DG23_9BACT|nr:PQQ-binding-like beta-propeller repeat protein [Fimbriiglobus ruber]OWK40490.1 putative polyvinylalcohol dehydrogenase [Fimbriiglobus ruber]
MLSRSFLLSALVVGIVGTVRADDWPQWRGPNRDGKSAEKGINVKWPEDGPKLLWSLQNPDAIGTGYGSPAVVGNHLFILGANGPKQDAGEFCTCLNVKDGSKVWQTPLNTTPGKFLDGWGAGPRATPTVIGDDVYVLGATGNLVCLTKADGKVVWQKNLVTDFGGAIPLWGYSESVLVDGDHVICTPGKKTGMIALDKKTGKTVWECKEFGDGAGYSSIIPTDIGGVRQYVQQTMSSGVGVRAKDGKLLWKVGEINRSVAVIPTPVVKDGHVFFTSGYRAGCELYRLEVDGEGTKATKVYSKNPVMANHHGGVIEFGGKIYGHSDSKQWLCLDYLNDSEDPVWNSSKLDKGSISFADGYFFCYGENKGVLAVIKATDKGWEEVARFSIPKLSPTRPNQGKVWAHPVIANGKLYLRDYEMLYCYDVSQPGA